MKSANKRTTPAWGKEVKKALIDNDMKITDLAKKLNLSRSHVTNVINGVFDFPDIQKQICEFLGVDTDQFH